MYEKDILLRASVTHPTTNSHHCYMCVYILHQINLCIKNNITQYYMLEKKSKLQSVLNLIRTDGVVESSELCGHLKHPKMPYKGMDFILSSVAANSIVHGRGLY